MISHRSLLLKTSHLGRIVEIRSALEIASLRTGVHDDQTTVVQEDRKIVRMLLANIARKIIQFAANLKIDGIHMSVIEENSLIDDYGIRVVLHCED